ncbi:MOSC domain-containing protein [Brevibacillus sp. SYP-B805]|uniref:MOSC domain-containing protein n=1 Tax=Brevibacillus sp. SYP-B805 TaxID=1578199 RepID=UPI0013EAAC63|nr:MOSC domain-containing protein [Brevibacillus sp. SYP-B805]NGQ96681.1 MOSC domain-containing protein [Brevibacillus sp. SYP-B805]
MRTFEARVEGVFVADDPSTFVTRGVPQIQVELGGIPGDRHYGLLRPADSRQHFYPSGTLIANRRQISIVSIEECARIAQHMGLPEIRPEWLGANLAVSGFPNLTLLPQGARLLFPDGAGLISEGENLPCIGPGNVIAGIHGDPGLAPAFVRAAQKLRGIVCSVEREGQITANGSVQIVIP